MSRWSSLHRRAAERKPCAEGQAEPELGQVIASETARMDMSATRLRLVARKRDLVAALRVLEQDHLDGIVDTAAYDAARRRYELEAAQVLEHLDRLPPDQERPAPRSQLPRRKKRWSWVAIAATAALVVVTIILFLITTVHPRRGTGSITGDVGQRTPARATAPSPQLAAAERAVYAHPRSVDALVKLGTAYLESGNAVDADLSYRAAMSVDPTRPEPKTFHAMLLGTIKQYRQALALLRQVERTHPLYAQAWLLDGLLSARTKHGAIRAIASWLRFLALEPRSRLAPHVRGWIVTLSKSMK
jgi:cytochrome c-type biogenesis protein CcmH/NrfG